MFVKCALHKPKLICRTALVWFGFVYCFHRLECLWLGSEQPRRFSLNVILGELHQKINLKVKFFMVLNELLEAEARLNIIYKDSVRTAKKILYFYKDQSVKRCLRK